MKYTIAGLNQKTLIKFKLNATDAIILRYIIDFWHTGKMYKINYEGKEYVWIRYDAIIEALPCIEITNKITLRRRFLKYEECGLMEHYHHNKKNGSYSCYRFTEKYEELIEEYNKKEEKEQEKDDTPLNSKVKEGLNSKVKLNKSINKNKSIKQILSKDNISVSKETHKKTFKKYKCLNKILLDFLKEILLNKESPFSTKLPKKDNDLISGVLNRVRSYLWDIKKNRFNLSNNDYEFNKDWEDDNNIKYINTSYESWEDVFRLIRKAIRRYKKMFQLNYWPNNKKWLTKSLADFFYNPMTKKSWFLYCLCNNNKEIRQTNGEKNSTKIFPKTKQGDNYLEYSKQFLKEVGKDRWDELIYWKKIKQLWLWYDKYDDALLVYNKGNFQTSCGKFDRLLNQIKEFMKTWNNDWTINNFGMNNKTWYLFTEWLKKEKGIELEPENNKLLLVIKDIQNQGRKIKNYGLLVKELKGNG